MYTRAMIKTLEFYSKFPVIAILGPRQSGKTTLTQLAFKNHTFVSLENPLTREFAKTEPEQFLKTHENQHGIIIDEFQYAPEILSYIQLDVDTKKRKNYFILTGSQNFLMNQAITQSLAGRVGILTLLPLSLAELKHNHIIPDNIENAVFNGCYPRLYDEKMDPKRLYPSYIHTYIERDVRQLINVENLETFQKFLQLCAARIGNLLNFSDLASACSISVSTAKRWISTLKASYIIFLLEPHFKNFNKRITKMPKLYFYDTGLACSLLRITSPKDLRINQYWGPLFECFIIADLAKQYLNDGFAPPLSFWRDKNGRIEVDCIIDTNGKVIPIEIKSSQRITADAFAGIQKWHELSQLTKPKTNVPQKLLIYTGSQKQERASGCAIPWQESENVMRHV